MKKIDSKQCREKFLLQYEKHKKYRYTCKDLMIYPVKTPEELVIESRELHHCVRTYVEKISNEETMILFVRKLEDKKSPFYTIELYKNKVLQIRGMHNSNATDEVREFVFEWCKEKKLKMYN